MCVRIDRNELKLILKATNCVNEIYEHVIVDLSTSPVVRWCILITLDAAFHLNWMLPALRRVSALKKICRDIVAHRHRYFIMLFTHFPQLQMRHDKPSSLASGSANVMFYILLVIGGASFWLIKVSCQLVWELFTLRWIFWSKICQHNHCTGFSIQFAAFVIVAFGIFQL